VIYTAEPILKALKERRANKGLTQRALAQKVNSPQSHIARIESGKADPKLSTVIELARTLEMEVMVIPRQLVPIVQSLVRGASKPKEGEEASTPRAAYALTEDEDE
jgi:predicted transcriptional regulator